jgi:hypothetical protein
MDPLDMAPFDVELLDMLPLDIAPEVFFLSFFIILS